jgi:hypothetical protein
MPLETAHLPDVTAQELATLLRGLDELPGKVSRVLYDKIVGHVQAQVNAHEQSPPAEANGQADRWNTSGLTAIPGENPADDPGTVHGPG